MLPNFKNQNYVSVKYKKDEELTELERQNKYLLLEIEEKRNINICDNKVKQDRNHNKLQQNQQVVQKKQIDEPPQMQNKIQNELIIKEGDSQNYSEKPQVKNDENSTENDYLLAQLLQQEINSCPTKHQNQTFQIQDFERLKISREDSQLQNSAGLTEKEKRFLQKQKQELEMYNKQKQEKANNYNLVEVNEDFINNIFNKQYPNNQQILDKIKKEKAPSNDNQALQLQRRSQRQIKEQQIQQYKQKYLQNQQQSFQNYVSPNENRPDQDSQKSDFQNLLKEVEGVQYCNLCGEYQRSSQMESHQNKCKMATVLCEFCNKEFPRYIISDHTLDCLRREEFKLLDLYQRTFASDGLQVNRTHQVFLGSRDYMRQQFNLQTFEQQKEIERLIVQNQKKIKKSYQNKVSRSEYYADVKYVKDPQSQQAEDCCICFVTFVEKETLGMLPCAHKFHTGCIDSWIKVKKLCPLCKRPF